MAAQYVFGAGDVWAIPQGTLLSGVDTTPVRFGTLQDIMIDQSQSTKELFGKLRLPVAVAGTQLKVTGKAKAAEFNAKLFNQIFWAGAITTGQLTQALGSSSLPGELSGTPTTSGSAFVYQTTHHTATPLVDEGAYDTVTGLYLNKVAFVSSTTDPGAGNYTYSAGSYYFHLAHVAIVFYQYTLSTGNNIVLPNIAMGANPTFSITLYDNQWQQFNFGMTLNLCGCNKVSMGFKNEDWMIPEFDFYAMDDGTGNWGVVNVDNVGT